MPSYRTRARSNHRAGYEAGAATIAAVTVAAPPSAQFGPDLTVLLGGPIDGADLDAAHRLVRGSSGVDRAIDLARSYIDDAIEAVAPLDETPAAVARAGSAQHLLVDLEAVLAA